MINLKRSVIIATPPTQVFDILNDTEHLPEIWRNLSNIRALKRIPNGGHSFEFDYSMVGITVEGAGIDLECSRPDRLVTRTTGGLTSLLNWTLEPLAAGAETKLTLDAAYEVPVPLVGRLAEFIISRVNDSDIVYVLNSIKLKLELGQKIN